MFGLNDSNSQNNSTDPKMAGAPPVMQDNPFNDGPPAGDSLTPPISQPATMPMTVPDLSQPPAAKPDPTASHTSSGNLLDLKQQALQSLQPLVSHLDQTPEEKFKTTMMLIQATDNSDLVSQAYEAANQIPDEKARAQALLDVVNEINYFTKHGETDSEPKA